MASLDASTRYTIAAKTGAQHPFAPVTYAAPPPSEAFLGTVAQISATFTAIIGALLVVPLLSLFGERGSAQQLLTDASARLDAARMRMADAITERSEIKARPGPGEPLPQG